MIRRRYGLWTGLAQRIRAITVHSFDIMPAIHVVRKAVHSDTFSRIMWRPEGVTARMKKLKGNGKDQELTESPGFLLPYHVGMLGNMIGK